MWPTRESGSFVMQMRSLLGRAVQKSNGSAMLYSATCMEHDCFELFVAGFGCRVLDKPLCIFNSKNNRVITLVTTDIDTFVSTSDWNSKE